MKQALEPIPTHWSIQNENNKAKHVTHMVKLGLTEGWQDYMREQIKRLAVEWPELPALIRAEFVKQKSTP